MKSTISQSSALIRIAAALERLAPPPRPEADPNDGMFFRFDGQHLLPAAITDRQILPLDRFVGVDSQMEALDRNFSALAMGGAGRDNAAHDMLLWGARGMGKSALLKSYARHHQVAMVQAATETLANLPVLFDRLLTVDRPFLVFIDDLAFAADDPAIRSLRSLLDGGVAARPEHVRLAVTSNHRHLLDRPPTSTRDVRHTRDVLDDQLALVDRFGLVLGFHVPDQDDYVEMVRRHLAAEGMDFSATDAEDAIAFALARGGRSGRTAWHYRTDVIARRQSKNQSGNQRSRS